MKRCLILALVALPAAAPAAEAKLFRSPSGNIGCYIAKSSGVRCDIAHHTWPTPPKPPWCDVDYGGGVQVGRRRKASFVCAGDTTLHQGSVLGYGRTITRGRFRCKSRSDGMRCVNRRTRHGFLLSRDRVDLF